MKYVNAFGALVAAAGGYNINPFIKITNPLTGSNIQMPQLVQFHGGEKSIRKLCQILRTI
jgi:hypothetical protein